MIELEETIEVTYWCDLDQDIKREICHESIADELAEQLIEQDKIILKCN